MKSNVKLLFPITLLLLFGSIPLDFKNIDAATNVEYLVIGGGAGGRSNAFYTGGGGGAGGYLNGTLSVLTQSYTITVGAAGAIDGAGGDSIFSTITAKGGSSVAGGGSGSGGNWDSTPGITGTAGQGHDGGDGGAGADANHRVGGGGGGAFEDGDNGNTSTGGGGAGGDGISNDISGSSVIRGGGGGGGSGVGGVASGGAGGGGAGGKNNVSDGVAGTANTGGGGGGDAAAKNAAIGGSGVVIIRYLTGAIDATGGTITTSGGYTIHTFTTSGTFTVIPHSVIINFSSFDVDIVGDAAKITGAVNIINGSNPETNQTGIIMYANNTIFNTNTTSTNGTTPFSVNFGPIWYYMNSDSIYNFTAQVFAQNSTHTVSNSSDYLTAREYNPDYFTAIDPTQGQVNYTFSDSNLLKVNRNTNNSLFNVECRFFTQAQAFQNQLSEGVWSNQTNVLFYTSDASGYYYVQCFNDGELFVSAINQNFSNALLPGLVIFDQLGGFFGAPSIILVIISILSLGTGRNYPIILLIAASVTGILLALQLLTLDAGLVVALIVMTGFGLFGIRKFY